MHTIVKHGSNNQSNPSRNWDYFILIVPYPQVLWQAGKTSLIIFNVIVTKPIMLLYIIEKEKGIPRGFWR